LAGASTRSPDCRRGCDPPRRIRATHRVEGASAPSMPLPGMREKPVAARASPRFALHSLLLGTDVDPPRHRRHEPCSDGRRDHRDHRRAACAETTDHFARHRRGGNCCRSCHLLCLTTARRDRGTLQRMTGSRTLTKTTTEIFFCCLGCCGCWGTWQVETSWISDVVRAATRGSWHSEAHA